MKKRMAIMLLAVTLLFGSIFGFKWFEGKMMGEYFASFRPPPVTVTAAHARQAIWNARVNSVGTLRARYGVEISAEVEGIVRGIQFVSGQEVNKGDVLLELDDSVEQASIKSFEARLKLARLNHKRDQQLVAKKLASQDRFDRSLAEYEEVIAQVELTRATIAKKKITAPFKGRMGILRVDPGQFLTPGTIIGSLQSLDALFLDFSLPEQNLPDLFVGQKASFTVDAYADRVFSAELFAIDSRVDKATRTIQVRARADNKESLLIPGMFADITLVLEPSQEVVMVPVTAINYSLYGEEVFVVTSTSDGEGNTLQTVQRKTVKSGQRQGSEVVIFEGVEAGQLIVIDGQMKLNNGAEVSLVDDVTDERVTNDSDDANKIQQDATL